MSFSLVYFGAAARHHDGHSESRKLIVDENRRLHVLTIQGVNRAFSDGGWRVLLSLEQL
jgi:hypothetical protein